jgi:hypothetical protein
MSQRCPVWMPPEILTKRRPSEALSSATSTWSKTKAFPLPRSAKSWNAFARVNPGGKELIESLCTFARAFRAARPTASPYSFCVARGIVLTSGVLTENASRPRV